METNKEMAISRKVSIALLVIADVIIYIIGGLWIETDKDIYKVPLFFFGPILVLLTLMAILEDLSSGHNDQFRELKPLSFYDSIQARAKKFLKLKYPFMKKSKMELYMDECIQSYAENGKINLTEADRTKLSLGILDTGISSQEPGYKSYYERERIAVIENILSDDHES